MSRRPATTFTDGSPATANGRELARGVGVGLPEHAGGALLSHGTLRAPQRHPLAHAFLVERFQRGRAHIPYAVPASGLIGVAPVTVIWSSPFRHQVGASAPPLRAAQTSVSTPRVVGMA